MPPLVSVELPSKHDDTLQASEAAGTATARCVRRPPAGTSGRQRVLQPFLHRAAKPYIRLQVLPDRLHFPLHSTMRAMAAAQAATAGWLLLTVLSQAAWGLYPVAARYFQACSRRVPRGWTTPAAPAASTAHAPPLSVACCHGPHTTAPFAPQTQAHPVTLTGLQVCLLMNAISAAAFMLCYSMPRRLLPRRRPKAVAGQRRLALAAWLQHQMSRMRHAVSVQALLPQLRRWSEGRELAEGQEEERAPLLPRAAAPTPPRPLLLRRPSLVEDTTSAGLGSSLRPQAVKLSLRITATPPASPRKRARIPGRLRTHAPIALPPAHSAPASPRAWLIAHGRGGGAEEPRSPLAVFSAPLGGLWPASRFGSVPTTPRATEAAGTPPPPPPLSPTSPLAGRLQGLPPGSPRTPRTPRAALRQPLLPATAEEEGLEDEWVEEPAVDLELGGTGGPLSSAGWFSVRPPGSRGPSGPGSSRSAAATYAAPAAAAAGHGAELAGSQPPAFEAPAVEAAPQEVIEERVQLLLQPFTLFTHWLTPWALAASEAEGLWFELAAGCWPLREACMPTWHVSTLPMQAPLQPWGRWP